MSSIVENTRNTVHVERLRPFWGVGGGVWHQVCILNLGVLNLGKWKLNHLSLCLTEAEWLLEQVKFQLDFFFFHFLHCDGHWEMLFSVVLLLFCRLSWPPSPSWDCLSLDVLGTLDFGHHTTPSTCVNPPVLPANFSPRKVVLIDSVPGTGVVSHSNHTVFYIVFHNCNLDGPQPREAYTRQVGRVMLFR